MKKIKEAVREAYAKGTFQKLSPSDQILFKMVDTTETNLLDTLLISEPFYWDVPQWAKTLRKYEASEILIPFSCVHENSDKILESFLEEGFTEVERFKTATSTNYSMICVRLKDSDELE